MSLSGILLLKTENENGQSWEERRLFDHFNYDICTFFVFRFGKQIRYASRKARADTRKRVKGRFVKAGEAYDYDPLVTRNFWAMIKSFNSWFTDKCHIEQGMLCSATSGDLCHGICISLVYNSIKKQNVY